MKTLFSVILCFNVFTASSQNIDEKWSAKYKNEDWTASSYVKLIDIINWKPVKIFKSTDIKTFKASLLELGPAEIKQMNISGWGGCSYKHDYYYTIWNLFYPKISKTTWDEHCKGLVVLMDLDGVINLNTL